MEDNFKFLWPSQKTWTLHYIATRIVPNTYFSSNQNRSERSLEVKDGKVSQKKIFLAFYSSKNSKKTNEKICLILPVGPWLAIKTYYYRVKKSETIKRQNKLLPAFVLASIFTFSCNSACTVWCSLIVSVKVSHFSLYLDTLDSNLAWLPSKTSMSSCLRFRSWRK